MCLLVLRDMDRMPRTKAALAGLDSARPFPEINQQVALLDTRIQALYGLLWVGLHLKGKPPGIKPYPIPEAKQVREKPQMDQRHLDYLNRFSPAHAA
ncbi:hypothetical protein GCM10023224_05030 [Streptomonospora halophila]|uniref:Uncharacterized protein n=1 Tax=Streptomonospora halophila TaxID=427369 RepID=A0ABP9G584_9ACTN